MIPSVDFASDASALPLADRSVDVVLSLELLEHVLEPSTVLAELGRALKPGDTVMVSVPSTVPRHDDNDYWRFTCLAEYYTALTLHVLHLPSRRVRKVFPSIGHSLDRHNRWSTSTTALHTLAFDLLFVGTAPPGD